jgi:hypothetical protein
LFEEEKEGGMRRKIVVIALCVIFFAPIYSYGAIGPGPLPDWHNDSQVQLGWVFVNPTSPQNTDIVPLWDKYVGGTLPSWNYDSSRTAWEQPAQWYIRIPNLVNDNPVKNFWISWVYEFDTLHPGPRSATNIDWPTDADPQYGNDSYNEVWFISPGVTTTNYLLANYAQVTMSLDLYPNPPYEDVYLGIFDGPGSPKYATEVYIKTRCVPIPPALYLMGSGLVGLIGIRRRMAKK